MESTEEIPKDKGVILCFKTKMKYADNNSQFLSAIILRLILVFEWGACMCQQTILQFMG